MKETSEKPAQDLLIRPVILFPFFCFTVFNLSLTVNVFRLGMLHVNRVREARKRALVFDTAWSKRVDVLFLKGLHSDGDNMVTPPTVVEWASSSPGASLHPPWWCSRFYSLILFRFMLPPVLQRGFIALNRTSLLGL